MSPRCGSNSEPCRSGTGVLLLALILLLPGSLALADTPEQLNAAQRLLRVAKIGDRFEIRAQQQARAIIYNYSVIIHRNTDYRLPILVERRIAECYQNAYQWEYFAEGIAHIVADNFSSEELDLLIDFHNNLGLPPNKIEQFRRTIDKAGAISQQSIDYIFANSVGCVDRDAELIIQHLQSNSVL